MEEREKSKSLMQPWGAEPARTRQIQSECDPKRERPAGRKDARAGVTVGELFRLRHGGRLEEDAAALIGAEEVAGGIGAALQDGAGERNRPGRAGGGDRAF